MKVPVYGKSIEETLYIKHKLHIKTGLNERLRD